MAVLSPVVSVLAPADWVVLVVYVVGIVAFGVWVGRRTRNVSDFFLAGREMRWWAAGLSVMATQISAITFVGTTGQAYTKGMSFLAFYFGLPFAMVVLSLTLVPFFYRAGVYTAYQYLERRFDGRTRTLTSLLFLLSRGLSVGVTLYAPSLVLSVIFGWSETATIAVMGGATIVYVVYGGNRSVIWTDVAQMALVWFGIFTCVGVAIAQLPAGVGAARRARPRPGHRPARDDGHLARPLAALHGLERAHRRDVPGHGLLRLRPEPGAALPLGPQPHREPPVAPLHRLPQGPDAVPDPAHRGPGVRLLPLPRDAAPVEPRGAGAARGAGPAGRAGAACATEAGAAHRERLAAAEAFARARHGGGDVASAREGYLAAQRRVDAAEAATRRLAVLRRRAGR